MFLYQFRDRQNDKPLHVPKLKEIDPKKLLALIVAFQLMIGLHSISSAGNLQSAISGVDARVDEAKGSIESLESTVEGLKSEVSGLDLRVSYIEP